MLNYDFMEDNRFLVFLNASTCLPLPFGLVGMICKSWIKCMYQHDEDPPHHQLKRAAHLIWNFKKTFSCNTMTSISSFDNPHDFGVFPRGQK